LPWPPAEVDEHPLAATGPDRLHRAASGYLGRALDNEVVQVLSPADHRVTVVAI
jgi:hypothetical protein